MASLAPARPSEARDVSLRVGGALPARSLLNDGRGCAGLRWERGCTLLIQPHGALVRIHLFELGEALRLERLNLALDILAHGQHGNVAAFVTQALGLLQHFQATRRIGLDVH